MAILALHTLLVLWLMARKRATALREGRIDRAYFKLYRGVEVPDDLRLWERHYANLLETPVLFYAAGATALAMHQASWPLAILGLLYVLARLGHSWVHLNGNRISLRFRVFVVSFVFLVLYWIVLTAGIVRAAMA
jgi:hypothetical protein